MELALVNEINGCLDLNSFVQDQNSYKIAVLPDQSTAIPRCESKISSLYGLEVSQPLERSLSLDTVFSAQNKVKGNMGNVDVYFPCIADADLEKGGSEKPKTKIEPIGNEKIENPSTVSSIQNTTHITCSPIN